MTRKILYLLLSVLFIINQSFGANINASITFSDKVYAKIVSNENISSQIKHLNFTEMDSKYEDNKYTWYLRINWDKKNFIYNFSPIYNAGEFNYTVKCDEYLSIKNESFKNGILEVHTTTNYKIMILGFVLFILLPLSGSLIFNQYVKRLLKTTSETETLAEKIAKNKKIMISYMAYAVICAIALLLSLFMCDLPYLLAYLSGIPGNIAFYITMILFIILIFLPIIISLKDMTKIYTKKVEKGEYSKSIGVLILPWVLGFIGIMVLTDQISKMFGDFLKKLPLPINIAFWMIVGYVAFYPGWKIVKKYLLKSKYVNNPEIVSIVNELIEKLNVKPFKEIKIIKNDYMANAMVSGLLNEKLIITTKLINILSKEELKSIISHEVAHKKRNHIKIGLFIWLMMGVLIFSSIQYIIDFTKNILGDYWHIGSGFIMLSYMLFIVVNRYFSKRREKEADIIASKITDPRTCIKALAKLYYANYMPKDGIFNIISTHPPLIKRIKHIQKEFNISDDEVNKIMDEAYNEIENISV